MTTQLLQSSPLLPARLIQDLSWEQVEDLDRSLADFAGVKLIYLDKLTEIMPISKEHEDFKVILRRLLEVYLDEMGIRFYGRGGPTLGVKALKARNEPDESYNLETKKPYPDLAIEITVTSGGVNKLEGYRRMGVPEVWFWEDGTLMILVLRDGGYVQVERSELLPQLPIDSFCRYITYYDQHEAVQEFRRLIRG
jgi:Uma2 family endonuclease